jgi:guanylate kinase
VIRARFEKALREIKRCLHYDYIVFNENIDKAVEEVTSIILSVRARRSKKLPMVEKIFSVSFSS